MRRADALAQEGAEGEWWEVEVALPDDTFQFDFVVVDAATGAVDNNRARDFSLPLAEGPSEQDVVERRAAAFAEAERARRALLRAEEERLRALAAAAAAEAAELARVEFRERRARELLEAAEAAVARARAPAAAAAPGAPGVATAAAVDGVYRWGGRVEAGARVTFAYNCASGPLAFTNAARLHLGVDGWRGKAAVAIVDLAPLKGRDLEALGLPSGGGSWCGAEVEVPAGAGLLDFVISDREQKTWDNNKGADYHTAVEAPAAAEEGEEEEDDPEAMAAAVLEALRAESAEADAAAEERAAARARARVESKAEVARRRREAQSEILYTVPVVPRAGEVRGRAPL